MEQQESLRLCKMCDGSGTCMHGDGVVGSARGVVRVCMGMVVFDANMFRIW